MLQPLKIQNGIRFCLIYSHLHVVFSRSNLPQTWKTLKNFKKQWKNSKFRKLSETVRTFPKASECICMHPNASKQVRTSPKGKVITSTKFQKTCNTSKNTENKTWNISELDFRPSFSAFTNTFPIPEGQVLSWGHDKTKLLTFWSHSFSFSLSN